VLQVFLGVLVHVGLSELEVMTGETLFDGEVLFDKSLHYGVSRFPGA